jgi:hypothetical protein
MARDARLCIYGRMDVVHQYVLGKLNPDILPYSSHVQYRGAMLSANGSTEAGSPKSSVTHLE